MKPTPLLTGWTCRHLGDTAPGKPVTLPHDAMLAEPRTALSAGGTNTGWYEGYDYEYQRTLTVPENELADTHILEFEGVYHNAEVWLNGQKAAFRPYGYTNFYVDCAPYLHVGENELRVIARNADQPNSRWYSGAGIYRPVQLWTAKGAHITLNGVKIRTLSLQPAIVEVRVKTTAPGTVRLTVDDLPAMQQESDGEAVFTLTLDNARLWTPETPNLYTCRVSFADDEVTETFGVRKVEWGTDGFLLNGKRYIIQGACIHHDNGLLGAVCDPDAVARKVRLLKENGYNAIRSAHNPCSKALLTECDRQGMLVMDEYIDHWYIHKTEHDYVDYFNDWWRQDLTDMVEKDYNHPCVVLYSTGNEVSETAQKRGIALTKEMTDFLHELDDSRPVTCGVNIFFNFLSSIGFGVYSDEKAKKEAERAEKAKQRGEKTSKKKAVGSQFFNNLAGLLGDEFMKRGATLHGCDVKTRDAFANMDIAGYNYGIYRYKHDLKKYPQRLILGSETFCNDAYKFRELAKQEPRLVGDFVWAGMDYLGEVMVGSWEYADYAETFDGGLGWVSAGSGRIDLTGKPLGEALYTRVALEADNGPYIAVCPVNHTGDRHSPSAWKMTNAMPSWSWTGCEGKKANVEVYARAARVELVLNGRTVGSKTLKNDCLARFSIPYESGTLEAVSYDAADHEIGRYKLQSAGGATSLTLDAEEPAAQTGHLCYVRLRYTDENGITKPLMRGNIQVQVRGGTLVGLGSACPFNKHSYLDSETDTYYGEALAIVRMGDGDAMTIAASDGEYSAELTVSAQA
ncbi:glycoside hydrolase family 2 TIM barrel-domain containing protein [Gemmiger sp.]|jgi:beta-galactosidase|uniref:glycoside hydrolase family 2 TIM barrel-domain containing protein n=1 Tax=Gemmiger sp. TaxID=2049027 RepID=UPI0025B8DACD|nr:glycoside hydrolase family 2 TIM barrel-domain containing protein [Gemmiger sp.]